MSPMPPAPGGPAAAFFFGFSATHRLGGDEEAGHGRRIMECRADDLGRVDHAWFHQIAVLAVWAL